MFSVDPTTAQTYLAVPWLRNMYRGTGDAECLRADELKSYDVHTKKPCGCTAYIQMRQYSSFTGAMAHCAAACHCPGSIPPHGTGKAGRTFKSLSKRCSSMLQLHVQLLYTQKEPRFNHTCSCSRQAACQTVAVVSAARHDCSLKTSATAVRLSAHAMCSCSETADTRASALRTRVRLYPGSL